MTQIYIVMQVVDLGGTPTSAYYDKPEADSKVVELNSWHKTTKIKQLIKGGYTTEAAEKWYGNREEFYIEEIVVQ